MTSYQVALLQTRRPYPPAPLRPERVLRRRCNLLAAHLQHQDAGQPSRRLEHAACNHLAFAGVLVG